MLQETLTKSQVPAHRQYLAAALAAVLFFFMISTAYGLRCQRQRKK